MRSSHVAQKVVRIALVCAVFFAGSRLPARAADGKTEDVAKSVHWVTGPQHLGASNADFATPAGGQMVTGTDAARMDEAVNGGDSSDTEGYVRLESGDTLYLEYNDSGYVTTDDFSKIDPDAMMGDIQKSTDDGNADRKTANLPTLTVDGWAEKPTFDTATQSARFIIADHDSSGNHFVNAVALQLGRKGYERFTLVAPPDQTKLTTAELDSLTRDYHFAPGERFADYVSGDKLAGIGIAALVSTAAGVTIAKTVGFGALIALLIKFKILVIGGIAALGGWFRNLFKRKTNVVSAMPKSSPFENPQPPLNP